MFGKQHTQMHTRAHVTHLALNDMKVCVCFACALIYVYVYLEHFISSRNGHEKYRTKRHTKERRNNGEKERQQDYLISAV